MNRVREQIAQVAPTASTVLITGESGTGKEVVAQAIHADSPRADRPFVRVNCGVLSESLVEAELFGHERGAFTNASARKLGRFELADGGSLLLDEIGELSLAAQAKLLRVIQEREFERVGGEETVRVNVRLIAATNVDLARAVADGRFREDLYYRLNVFTIHLPALRERPDDILPLAEHFLAEHAAVHDKRISGFTAHAQERLMGYDWPGNVRELENAVERAVIICDREQIHQHHLPPAMQTVAPLPAALSDGLFAAVEAYERDLIRQALKVARGTRAEAARLLKVSSRALSYKIEKYKIVCEQFRR